MIKFYYGTVGSGKSLTLLSSYLNDLRKFPDKVSLIKPEVDNRTEGIFTRFGNVEIAPSLVLSETNKLTWYLELRKKEIFYIDEVQFVSVDIIKDILAYRKPNQVFNLYGLRNDYNKKSWDSISFLFNHADYIQELPTTCDVCKKNKASFNKKLDLDIKDDIGFNYIPVCYECYPRG